MRKVLISVLLFATIAASAQKKAIVYFRTSESKLLPAARVTLDSLARSLRKTAKCHLNIDGFCDSSGTHPGNIVLGKDRAMSVFNYLKKQGIADESMTIKGHAESDPAAPGSDPASKAKNRRVEILCILPASSPIPAVAPKEVQKQSSDLSVIPAPTPEKIQKQPSEIDSILSFANMKVGQKIVLKNLNFENNSTELLSESLPIILALLKCMRENPTLEIKLCGHVCCNPDMKLSVARAKFVYDYLVINGIDPSRMRYEGFSNRAPLLPNDAIDWRAAKVNRRVEMIIMHK